LLVGCRDALHGWGQVVLSVNVSPVTKDYDETAHVLKASMPACHISLLRERSQLVPTQRPLLGSLPTPALSPPLNRLPPLPLLCSTRHWPPK
jgi:hypothetical protein